MKLCGFIDCQRKDLRDGQAVLGRRMARIIEKLCWRGFEALEVSPQRNVEPLAVGGSLLMGERKAAERLRQCLGLRALSHTAGAGNEKIGADIPGPDPDFPPRGNPA